MSGDRRFAVNEPIPAVRCNTEVALKQVCDRKTFFNETVVIDDTRFVKCVFISCTLQYSGGDWDIDDCRISEDCAWSFNGPAFRTASLLKMFGMIKAASILESKENPDQIN